jgi:hypothetical protein
MDLTSLWGQLADQSLNGGEDRLTKSLVDRFCSILVAFVGIASVGNSLSGSRRNRLIVCCGFNGMRKVNSQGQSGLLVIGEN